MEILYDDIYQLILLQADPSDYYNLFLSSKKFKPMNNILKILKEKYDDKYNLWQGSTTKVPNASCIMYRNEQYTNWVKIKNIEKMYNEYMKTYKNDNNEIDVFGNGELMKINFMNMNTVCSHTIFDNNYYSVRFPCGNSNHNNYPIRRKPTWEYELTKDNWVLADDSRIDYFYSEYLRLGVNERPGLVYHCFGDGSSSGIDFENMTTFCLSSHKGSRCSSNHNKFKIRHIKSFK